ncbi:phage protease [Micromonospora sp. NPDC053740]|uniref:phage protease n=1 Tax=Micromonospora sp. NPDC053740 TaxID=3155173 RepID=UPI00343241B4
MTLTVPAPPTLARVNRVELVHTGSWNAKSGPVTFTPDDLASAVGAFDCPAVRRPVLKFGHDGNHGAGDPAIGWVDNLALDDDGGALVGDFVGMPAWLATPDSTGSSVLSSAYPDRSIEGEFDYRCQLGHNHPFVVHAVALLGVERPGVGTLPSLQGLAAVYGVELADGTDPTGTAVTVAFAAERAALPNDEPVAASVTDGRSIMPNPRPAKVAASVSVEDVRRDYYDKAPWSHWITEVHLDPLQLIVVDDDSGQRWRVPVDVTGDDTFTFGEPVQVLVRYVDKPEQVAASVGQPIVYASRAESRPGQQPTASTPTEPAEPTAEPVEPAPAEPLANPELPAAEPEPTTEPKEDPVSTMSDVRSRLGLPDDADEAAVSAAVLAAIGGQPTEHTTDATPEAVTEPETPAEPTPVAASTSPALPDGVVTIDREALAELRRNATLGATAHERQRVADRDATIAAAMNDGKFAPARKDHWVKAWEADPEGTKATLSALESGLIPMAAAGTAGPGEPEVDELGINDTALGSWANQLGVDAKELSRG